MAGVSGGSGAALRLDGGTLLLRVRLTPNADRDAFAGPVETKSGPAIAARVRAVPEKGKANDALIRLVAKTLGVAPTSVSLASGDKDRVKLLAIEMSSADSLTATASALGIDQPITETA